MVKMKTTIDLPDDLLHRAKVVAAQRKVSLKELMTQGLDYVLTQPALNLQAERKARAQQLIALLSVGRNTEPVGKWNREEIHDRHQGKWE